MACPMPQKKGEIPCLANAAGMATRSANAFGLGLIIKAGVRPRLEAAR
jgi:hypothetical protein